MRQAISAAVITLLIGVGCDSVTGLEDPTKLEKGSFRAEVTGAVDRSIRGDVNLTFGRLVGGMEDRVLRVRLNAPPGIGADSVRFDFLKKHPRLNLPASATWSTTSPLLQDSVPTDSVFAYAQFGVNSSDLKSYLAITGSLTLLETADADEVAGRFEYMGRRPDVGDTITVRGAFLGGAP